MSLENIYKKLVQLNAKEFNIKKKESGTIDKIQYINSSLDNDPVKESVDRVQKDEAEVKKLKVKLEPHVNCYGDLIDTRIKLGAGEGIMRIYESIERGSKIVYSTIPEKILPYFIITKDKIINFDYTMGPEYKIEYITYDHKLQKLSKGKDDCVSHIDFLSKVGAANENVIGPNIVEKYTQDINLKSSIIFDYEVKQAMCYMPISGKGLQYIKYDIRHPKGVIYAKKFHILGNKVIGRDGYINMNLSKFKDVFTSNINFGEDLICIRGSICDDSKEYFYSNPVDIIHIHGSYYTNLDKLIKLDYGSNNYTFLGSMKINNLLKMNNILYYRYNGLLIVVLIIKDKIIKISEVENISEICECGVYKKNNNYYNIITNELIANFNYDKDYEDSYKINIHPLSKNTNNADYGSIYNNKLTLKGYDTRSYYLLDTTTETYIACGNDSDRRYLTHSTQSLKNGDTSTSMMKLYSEKDDCVYATFHITSSISFQSKNNSRLIDNYKNKFPKNDFWYGTYFNNSIVFGGFKGTKFYVLSLKDANVSTPTNFIDKQLSEGIKMFSMAINNGGNILCIVSQSNNIIILDKDYNEIKKIPIGNYYDNGYSFTFVKENIVVINRDLWVNLNTGKIKRVSSSRYYSFGITRNDLDHTDIDIKYEGIENDRSTYDTFTYDAIQYRYHSNGYIYVLL